MKVIVAFFIFIITTVSYAQVSDSPLSAYSWKGKKTVLSPGYVVLKSGKKMQGQIALQGKPGSLSGIYFEGEGKEIDFPIAAISAYGLKGADAANSTYYKGPIICEVNEDLFTWRDMGVQMDKQINNTKPRNGYVVKRDGSLIEGELQIKMVDGIITEFVVKADKKFKVSAAQVGRYGLQILMADITKNGEKTFSDDAKNFHKGVVTLSTGETLEGMIAFKDKKPINPNRPGAGDMYNGMYYAKDEATYIKSYSDDQLLSVKQYVNGEEVLYSPYQGGFVSSTTMDNARYADQAKAFNPGTVILFGGETKTGEVAKPNNTTINFRSPEGIISAYAPNDIEKVSVEVEGEDLVYINSEGIFVEEFVRGKTFWVYENPNPTTVNQRRTNLVNGVMSAGTSIASTAVLNQTEKQLGIDANLDSIVRSTSTEDLIAAREQTARANGYRSVAEMEERGIENETVAKLDLAMQLELASRSSANDVVIYYEELVVINLQTGDKMILYKDKSLMNDKLEGLLMGCYTFLELDKKEQKEFYDIDNIKQTFKMLEECY